MKDGLATVTVPPGSRAGGIGVGLPEPVLVLDSRGCVVAVNGATRELFGYAEEELVGRPATDLVPEALRATTGSLLTRFLARRRRRRGARPFQVLGRHRDGSIFTLEVSFGELVEEGRRLHPCLVRDVSRRTATERRLRESEQRHALAPLRGANDGFWDWDLEAGTVAYSSRWARMLGLSTDEVGTGLAEWFDRVLPENLPRLREHLQAHLARRTGHFQDEHRIRHADGSVRWVLARGLAVWDGTGRARRIAGALTDITDRKEAQERLRHEVLHDHLTGLPNRTFFLDRLRNAVTRARRRGVVFSVLYIDLDGLKPVNDSFGHAAGDALLVEFAGRLRRCLRPSDAAARMGGDEFVVLVDGDVDAAVAVAERLGHDLGEPFAIAETCVSTSASMGIARWMSHHQLPDDVLRDAERRALPCQGPRQGPARRLLPGSVSRRRFALTEPTRRTRTDIERILDRGARRPGRR